MIALLLIYLQCVLMELTFVVNTYWYTTLAIGCTLGAYRYPKPSGAEVSKERYCQVTRWRS
jgi:hypothetical protein